MHKYDMKLLINLNKMYIKGCDIVRSIKLKKKKSFWYYCPQVSELREGSTREK